MPIYSAIALERLFEPGASKSNPNSNSNSNSNSNPTAKAKRNSSPSIERKPSRPHISSPALYATPEAFTPPLPDSPSSFSPSPYIVNHKRRGPRLGKSSSEEVVVVASTRMSIDDEDVIAKKAEAEAKAEVSVVDVSGKLELVNGFSNSSNGDDVGISGKVSEEEEEEEEEKEDDAKLVVFDSEIDVENDDFFDPNESMSYISDTSDDVEDNKGVESTSKLVASIQTSEFYDARDELSSESGQRLSSLRDIEAELREMRLNLLMEIEKREQAEEALSNMQSWWPRMREQLGLAGLTLPASLGVVEGEPAPSVLAAELCQQVYIARFVANCLGRGTAKAEMEMEMEAQIEAKNLEVARLCDRLHYYEAMNHEMSQRNQEAIEMARRKRTVRKKRQQWVWGSIAAVITLGTAALAWSYLAPTNGSSSSNLAQAPEHDDATKQ